MPVFAAIAISLVGAALGGFVLQSVSATSGFLPPFAVIAICMFFGIGVFNMLNNALHARASSQANSTAPSKDKKRASSQTKQTPKKANKKAQKQTKPTADKGRSDADLEQGTVKWFNGNKGFGFIRRENGEEVFVHFRSIANNDGNRRVLRDGQEVEFRVVVSDRGPQAEDVRVL